MPDGYFTQIVRCRKCGQYQDVIANQGVVPGCNGITGDAWIIAAFVYCPSCLGSTWHDIVAYHDSDGSVHVRPDLDDVFRHVEMGNDSRGQELRRGK